jgi:peroxiredoxin
MANLFPPTIVKIGDTMADMPLLDTQMAIHTLAEYKGMGKYLLLDFGFINCGSCMEAIPETKVLYDSLINKLTIIGINVDETAYWKAKSKENPISWVNLNDSKGRSGLTLRYGVKAYPYYVIISPDGIVLGAWIGYEKGELTGKIMPYIKNR